MYASLNCQWHLFDLWFFHHSTIKHFQQILLKTLLQSYIFLYLKHYTKLNIFRKKYVNCYFFSFCKYDKHNSLELRKHAICKRKWLDCPPKPFLILDKNWSLYYVIFIWIGKAKIKLYNWTIKPSNVIKTKFLNVIYRIIELNHNKVFGQSCRIKSVSI